MFILSQKLKMLKEALKLWNKNTFGDVHSQVTLAYKDLDEIQLKIDTNGCTDILLNLENALNQEEIFWHEKSKVKWHCEGDRNTTYFH